MTYMYGYINIPPMQNSGSNSQTLPRHALLMSSSFGVGRDLAACIKDILTMQRSDKRAVKS
jgi:hypothetical protein